MKAKPVKTFRFTVANSVQCYGERDVFVQAKSERAAERIAAARHRRGDYDDITTRADWSSTGDDRVVFLGEETEGEAA